jgi:dipeptidase
MNRLISAVAFAGLATMVAPDALACTNLVAAKGATTDGSVMTTYSADSHSLYGFLHHNAAKRHDKGDVRVIREWDTNKLLGEIPEVEQTYNVVGNMNEHQLVIGESTWGGRPELTDTTGQSVVDYGSLIYVTLERAKTAREAIDIMTQLVADHGYASSGESFTIADKNEVWVMEMIGKGAEKGAVWIAVRIPDNAITGHANEPRIRKVNLKDKENVRYSKDMISFARKRGLYTGKDEDFSFADVYGEHDASTRRGCDARVWSYFRRFNKDADKYYDWCAGKSNEPMPLYIVPDRKVSLEEMQDSMRDHFEGTPFEMTSDIGSGPYHVPYRWRPMEYEVDGKKYCMERAIATQQTGWSFVSQSRDWLPDKVGGLLWFGTDDTNTSVYMPFYCGMTEVPVEVSYGDINTFDPRSNFWMTNIVANQAYNRYDQMIPDIRKVQQGLEKKFIADVPATDKKLADMVKAGHSAEYTMTVNDLGAKVAKDATDAYRDLGTFLFVKYMDGNVKKTDENGNFIKSEDGMPVYPTFPGYDKRYYEEIVKSTGEHFLINN